MQELTLAVVGIDFPNENGSNRRSDAMMTPPGAPIGLVPEPKNKHDPNAICCAAMKVRQQRQSRALPHFWCSRDSRRNRKSP
jgi:hypothetical protein